MKCHYEVLSVPRDASDSDIKVAYRKLALRWHPDKNLDNLDLAKEQFQVVQQAYEVLSDRQERAWYDNHREQILRGSSSDYKDQTLDVFQYFNTSCFKGYEDDENGFYTVFRNVFDNIAKEDLKFMDDKEEFCEIPSFANSKTDYEKVSEFYNYWSNYSTRKSYVWLDPHDIVGIKDRRYIKAVEKENKKVRQKAKKERNEEVRNLVAFVKKRDKRVQAQKKIQAQKMLENKKKRELLSKQKRLERREELKETQPEWCKFDNVKSELEEIEKNLAEEFGEMTDSEEEDVDEDFNNLYCVACNKVFKTPKAFENHELSKKHKENIVLLKESMLDENDSSHEMAIIDDDVEQVNFDNNHSQSETETLNEVVQIKSKKKKKPRNVLATDLYETHKDLETILNSDNSDNEDFTSKKKTKRKNKKNNLKTSNGNGESVDVKNTDLKITVNGVDTKTKVDKVKKEKEQNLVDIDHNCVTCKSSFPSKNKLFNHLKKTGHGVYLPPNIKSKKNIVK